MADFEIRDYRELTREQRIAPVELVEKRMEIDLKNYRWPGEGYNALCMLKDGKPIGTVEYSFQNGMFRIGDIVSKSSPEFVRRHNKTPTEKLFSIVLEKGKEKGMKKVWLVPGRKEGERFIERQIKQGLIRKPFFNIMGMKFGYGIPNASQVQKQKLWQKRTAAKGFTGR